MLNTILVQKRTLKQKMRTILLPIVMSLFLSACTTGLSLFTNEVTESLRNEAYSSSEFYVNKLTLSLDPESRESYRLLAIRQLLAENKIVEAKNMLAELSSKLNEIQQIEYQLVTAKLMIMENKKVQADQALKLLPLSQLSRVQMKRYYKILVKIAEKNKNIVEAVRTSILLDGYLVDTKEHQLNNNNIWALLRRANKGMLSATRAKAGETTLAGWLSLIQLYNDNLSTPETLVQAINSWKALYPSHSAAILLPTELKAITSFQQTQFNHIALLLPLSGDLKFLGEIIQQGFDDARGMNELVSVNILDTNSESLNLIVQNAKVSGAQAVIGPLLKSKVDEMLHNTNIDGLSILALNATNNSRARAKVCYYGLSPEAEAYSAADKMRQDGVTQALVIAPNGDFGMRSANAFAARWRKVTNTDADVRYYDQAIDIVTNLQNIEYVEGQSIYFLGNADQLLEAKEALDSSEFANKFTIYTSSRSHSPNSNADFYTTMEGVKFSEIPLLSDRSSEQYKMASKVAKSDFSMMRLYAMGADAWTLINNFNELRQIPGFTISGLTGELKAGVNCHIERNMKWLKYSGSSVISDD
ncbi:penicillin-binding protein activator [Pasteurella skyensis]|uniref:Penicillin-binding protein activator n=1 Tax=Phocoenobacter skyensis TaxID=97481 RepID=A0AAJ6N8J8_9PAST|nr:penicillin-binding protein activator [Pasteurella skyensis]MDP8162045.1 penicillin-binding protein activator [Pasteurella skyensis]MDP8172201.1 penicillin-binding protein activator [Pasteurella skyensis]MDP8176450.1 penicillin-binding protein activator [Pasteurella skyensis]MDP8178339.1 penicillin-binding protein activator [Pasteurella skyensis]MDP8182905.1 penicillin-binding protein activator [Pasteurella skyensis]